MDADPVRLTILRDSIVEHARALVHGHIPGTSTFAYPESIALLVAVELYESALEDDG